MTATQPSGKFIKYSLIFIIILLILTIALSITTLVMDAVDGGGPSMDEMCKMMPPGTSMKYYHNF